MTTTDSTLERGSHYDKVIRQAQVARDIRLIAEQRLAALPPRPEFQRAEPAPVELSPPAVYSPHARPSAITMLNEREYLVTALAAAGVSVAGVGVLLDLSERTIRDARHNAAKHAGVETRELDVWAGRHHQWLRLRITPGR
jgi:DNA-binding NarL/FixJ family response regulator